MVESNPGAETVQFSNRPHDATERAEGSSLFQMMMGMTPEEWDTPVLSESDEEDE